MKMKKYGFTLAEVLVTRGIIGVVAALTTPALIQNVGNAKVGPKLAKAKSTFENAVTTMLVENSSNSLLGALDELPKEDDDQNAAIAFGKKLSEYMKISPTDRYNVVGYNGRQYFNNGVYQQSMPFVSDDGMVYWLWPWKNHNFHPGRGSQEDNPYPDIPAHQLIGAIYVDVNGSEAPNKMAKDVFLFYMFNDGSIRPAGSSYFKNVPHYNCLWDENAGSSCNKLCNKDVVEGDGETCAGSIFDNGLKIIYE